MGRAGNAGLLELTAQYNLDTFVESGTGWGHSVQDALSVPTLRNIYSIEIDEQTYERNLEQFSEQISSGRVKLFLGDSREILPAIARMLPLTSRVYWYLDAHFPGSGRNDPVPMLPLRVPPLEAVPVEDELRGLLRARNLARDVIVVDDRCLWEADDYTAESEDTPDFRGQLQLASLLVFDALLSSTHHTLRTTVDMGYYIATPK